MISTLIRKVTKDGRSWAMTVLEDLEASMEVLFFPKTYEVIGAQLADGAAVAVKGKLDRRDGTPRLVGMELVLLNLEDSAQENRVAPVVLSVPTAKVTPDLIAALKHTLQAHPGPCPVHIKLRSSRGELVLAINEDYRVERSGAFLGDLKSLLGAGCLA